MISKFQIKWEWNSGLRMLEWYADGTPIVIPVGPAIVYITYFDESSSGQFPPRFFYVDTPFVVLPKRTFYAWAGKVVAK